MLPTPRRRTVPALTLTATATAAVALLAALPGAAAHAAPSVQAAGTGWSPDLSAVDGDDVNVRHDGKALRLASGRTGPASLRGATAAGQLMLAPRDLAEPVNRVTAQVTGAGPVQVDVRARTGSRRVDRVDPGRDGPAAWSRGGSRRGWSSPGHRAGRPRRCRPSG